MKKADPFTGVGTVSVPNLILTSFLRIQHARQEFGSWPSDNISLHLHYVPFRCLFEFAIGSSPSFLCPSHSAPSIYKLYPAVFIASTHSMQNPNSNGSIHISVCMSQV